jgi:two-component system, cell cycle sensor histidine kinase and response regulator CckA
MHPTRAIRREPPLIEAAGQGHSYMAGAESIGILLVDDQGELRRLLGCVLQRAGFRVFEAASGEEALDLFSRDGARIQLLITDVVMPGMDGSELARRVSRKRPAIKVLFISGYSGHKLPAGAPFLLKPFSPKALLKEIEALLHQPAAARAGTA